MSRGFTKFGSVGQPLNIKGDWDAQNNIIISTDPLYNGTALAETYTPYNVVLGIKTTGNVPLGNVSDWIAGNFAYCNGYEWFQLNNWGSASPQDGLFLSTSTVVDYTKSKWELSSSSGIDINSLQINRLYMIVNMTNQTIILTSSNGQFSNSNILGPSSSKNLPAYSTLMLSKDALNNAYFS